MPPTLNPRHPERVCWGCDEHCPADDLACGNGSIRTMHPAELFGDDWLEWSEVNGPKTAAEPTTDILANTSLPTKHN